MYIRITAMLLFFAVAKTDAQNIAGVVNIYRKVLWADSASGRLKLSDVSGLSTYVGNKVLIVQMKGATMNQGSAASDASFGNITAINGAGYYEIGSICGFLSDTMVLERKLNNLYEVGGLVQAVIMPKYNDVTVTDTLKAADWDPATGIGGVVAIEATGTLYLNKPISANGAGFRGGTFTQYGAACNVNPLSPPSDYYMPYTASAVKTGGKKGEGIADYVTNREYARGKQVNGGGGGNNHNSGGGGGGNYGAGGDGGNRVNNSVGVCRSFSPGIGGLGLSSYGYALSPAGQNKIFMGGGGGAGHDNDGTGLPGGNGGGIVFIIANSIQGNSATASDNSIMANGAMPYRYITIWSVGSNASGSDGSGGGGAGGTVVVKTNSFTGNAITIESKGATGGGSEAFGQNQCCGPGGGGGGGMVWLSTNTAPGGLTVTVTGGANGTTSSTASCANSANGATSGGNGLYLSNFALAAPKDSSPVCKQVLPLYATASISGYQQGQQRIITALANHPDNIQSCTLEKASSSGNFAAIAQTNVGQQQYRFVDGQGMGLAALYRIKLVSKDGVISYSAVLRLGAEQPDKKVTVAVYPNPSRDKASLQVYTATAGMATLSIANAQGHWLWQQRQPLQKGYNVLSLPLNLLPDGLLLIQVDTGADKAVQSFVKFGL